MGRRTGLGTPGRAEAGEGLAAAAAVEVGVGAGQGQGRVGVARVLFVAGGNGGRKRIEMDDGIERGAAAAAEPEAAAAMEDAAAVTSAAAERGKDGGHAHRPGWRRRRRGRIGRPGRRVATDETWSLVVGARAALTRLGQGVVVEGGEGEQAGKKGSRKA